MALAAGVAPEAGQAAPSHPLGSFLTGTQICLRWRPFHTSRSPCGRPDTFLSSGRSGIEEQHHQGLAVRAGPGLQGARRPPPLPHVLPAARGSTPLPQAPSSPRTPPDLYLWVLTQSEACACSGSLGLQVAWSTSAWLRRCPGVPDGACPVHAWRPVQQAVPVSLSGPCSGATALAWPLGRFGAGGGSLLPQSHIHVFQGLSESGESHTEASCSWGVQCPDPGAVCACTQRPQLCG